MWLPFLLLQNPTDHFVDRNYSHCLLEMQYNFDFLLPLRLQTPVAPEMLHTLRMPQSPRILQVLQYDYEYYF